MFFNEPGFTKLERLKWSSLLPILPKMVENLESMGRNLFMPLSKV
jgi:hypothetical protein